MKDFVRFENLHVDYLRKGAVAHVLKGISLDVTRGQCLGVVGESGCGKTTLASALLGLVIPAQGRILLEGEELGRHRSSAQRRRIQMVFQDPVASLNPRRTVRSVLSELMIHHKLVGRSGLDAALKQIMDRVRLPAAALDAYPARLSGGQRQRIAIARALVVQPDVLVADEAVSALDVSVQAHIINLLRELCDDLGLTMIFISHNLAVVRVLCDRVAVMHGGHVVEDRPTEAIFADPQHDYTRALLKASLPMGILNLSQTPTR